MPVEVRSVVGAGARTVDALAALEEQLSQSACDSDFAVVFYNVNHDDTEIYRWFRERFPDTPLTGGTSGQGLFGSQGLAGTDAIGLLLLIDPDGNYGAASVDFATLGLAAYDASAMPLSETSSSVDPAAEAAATLHRALEAAGTPGELPQLIWLFQTCGVEDMVLAGLRSVVGQRCPIIGASAADDDETGRWRQMGTDGPITNGVALAVIMPSGGVGVSFQGGFEPIGRWGTVTDAGQQPATRPFAAIAKQRHIARIDDRPAADVYFEWLQEEFGPEDFTISELINRHSIDFALGVPTGETGTVVNYRLVQTIGVSQDGGLILAADISVGSHVFGMRSHPAGIIRRGRRTVQVATETIQPAKWSAQPEPAGALMVYCTDCYRAVGDDIDTAIAVLQETFGTTPFLGCFSYGEQGPTLDTNVHANLMISAIVFGR